MPKTFCVVGHDARQQAAAHVLRRAGYGVTAADNAAAADYILLPMSQGRVSDEVARALQGAGQGTWIFAGRPGMPVRTAVRQANLPLVDYFLRPELESLNAVPTAEGCLELLLRLRQRTIWESDFLVLGYGRVGRAVARRLGLLGGRVTVAARNAEQRANARCAGCRAAPLTALPGLLPEFDAVINTIPAPVLPRALLQKLPGGALIIDLASLPGGTDFVAAEELGLHAEHALALPGRPAEIEIYSREDCRHLLPHLTAENGLRFCGAIPGTQVAEQIAESFLLINAESFAPDDLRQVSLSISTKLADYLAYAPSILAYGPEGAASIRYLREQKAAFVITSEASLAQGLLKALTQESLRAEYRANARRLAAQNHDPDQIHRLLHTVLAEAAWGNRRDRP